MARLSPRKAKRPPSSRAQPTGRGAAREPDDLDVRVEPSADVANLLPQRAEKADVERARVDAHAQRRVPVARQLAGDAQLAAAAGRRCR